MLCGPVQATSSSDRRRCPSTRGVFAEVSAGGCDDGPTRRGEQLAWRPKVIALTVSGVATVCGCWPVSGSQDPHTAIPTAGGQQEVPAGGGSERRRLHPAGVAGEVM